MDIKLNEKHKVEISLTEKEAYMLSYFFSRCTKGVIKDVLEFDLLYCYSGSISEIVVDEVTFNQTYLLTNLLIQTKELSKIETNDDVDNLFIEIQDKLHNEEFKNENIILDLPQKIAKLLMLFIGELDDMLIKLIVNHTLKEVLTEELVSLSSELYNGIFDILFYKKNPIIVSDNLIESIEKGEFKNKHDDNNEDK